jgi:hypothetical protein
MLEEIKKQGGRNLCKFAWNPGTECVENAFQRAAVDE